MNVIASQTNTIALSTSDVSFSRAMSFQVICNFTSCYVMSS